MNFKNLSPGQKKSLATLLVVASGSLYGFMGFFGTQLFREHFSVMNMLFWRFFIAALWMVLCGIFLKKTKNKMLSDRKGMTKIILLSTLSYSVGTTLYFIASRSIGTGLAMVVFFSFPVFVTLFSWLKGDWHINRYGMGALLAIVTGLFFLRDAGMGTVSLAGLLLAALSAFAYAVYIYGNRHSANKVDLNQLTLLLCLGNAAFFLITAEMTHTFAMPDSLRTWFYAIMLGVVATAIPIQLMFAGLKYLSPVKASILSVLEPVITVLVGFLLLGETISGFQFVGVVIILAGAILIQFERPVEV